MRLLWSESAAPPEVARAKDFSRVFAGHKAYIAACFGRPGVQLVDVEDGVVARWVHIGGPGPTRESRGADRILRVGTTEVEILDGDSPLAEWLEASWSREGWPWFLYALGPVTDAELAELVRLVDVPADPGDDVDIDGWPVLAEAEFVFHSNSADELSYRFRYEVEGEGLSLETIEKPSSAWLNVWPGDRLVDVAGKSGLLSGNALYWVPAEGVFARIFSSMDAERLLEVAQTIAPVPADDERLAEAWETRMP